jgi:hypothetical protein
MIPQALLLSLLTFVTRREACANKVCETSLSRAFSRETSSQNPNNIKKAGWRCINASSDRKGSNKQEGGAVIILMHPRCYLTHKRPDYEFLPQAELTFALLSSFFLFNLGIAYDTGLQNGGISLDFFFWSTHKRQIFVIDARARAAGSQSVSASVVRLTN